MFSIFITDLEGRIENILTKSADYTKLGMLANVLEDWAIDNKMQIIEGKCKVLHTGEKEPNVHTPTGSAALPRTIWRA